MGELVENSGGELREKLHMLTTDIPSSHRLIFHRKGVGASTHTCALAHLSGPWTSAPQLHSQPRRLRPLSSSPHCLQAGSCECGRLPEPPSQVLPRRHPVADPKAATLTLSHFLLSQQLRFGGTACWPVHSLGLSKSCQQDTGWCCQN